MNNNNSNINVEIVCANQEVDFCDYELDNNIQNILNNQMLKALIDMLYKNNLINKKEHTMLLNQTMVPL